MESLTVKKDDKFQYIEEGPDGGQVMLLLHGLFGTASNFDETILYFKDRYKIYLPILPIFEMSVRKLSVYSLMEYVREFVEHFDLKDTHIIGNSLGGHIALLYVLDYMEDVKSLTLTGSSGLYENSFGSTFPRRGDKNFIRNKINLTFYDKGIVTEEMVDEIYDITSDTRKCLSMVKTAKSAIRHNVGDQIPSITTPTLLVWGKQDTITPPFVGEEFKQKMPNARLDFIDKCGHAPMLETPEQFNKILEEFLDFNS